MLNRLIFILAAATGIAIAYVDSRPTWDDAGITALSLLVSAALFGAMAPRMPWLVALCVGIWIPAYAIVRTPTPGTAALLLVLLFPIAGAYIGAAIRKLVYAQDF